MRICLLTEYFNPNGAGGTPTMLPALMHEIKALFPTAHIDIITSRNIYRGDDITKYEARECWHDMTVYRMNTPSSNRDSTALRVLIGFWFSLQALIRLLTLPRYDLLFVGTNPPAAPWAALILKRLRRTPYVYLIHDLFPDVGVAVGALRGDSRVVKLAHRMQQSWLHGASRVVVIGRDMREHLVSHYLLPAKNVVTIPNWADPDAVMPLDKATSFRAKHGLHGFVVLYSGNLGEHHDFDVILDTARILQSTQQQVTFVFVGEGAKKEYLAARISEEKLNNVRLFPFVPSEDFADLLASADVSLVTLSQGVEGMGVPSKFYNILASGRPTIALVAAKSEVAYVLGEERCGIRVDLHDIPALVSAISLLFDDAPLAAQMGRMAREALERRYTITTSAKLFFRTFEEAIAS